MARPRRPLLLDYDTFPFDWVTPQELARFKQCDKRTVLRMIANGRFPNVERVGHHWRIPKSDARAVFPRRTMPSTRAS